MRIIPRTVALAGMLLIVACQLSDTEVDNIAFGIREDIVLEMKHQLSPAGAGLGFVFKTISPYACEGAGFEQTTSYADGRVEIRLYHLDIPEPCLGGLAPATAEIDMPVHPGTYDISIRMGDVIENTGTLIIDHKGYRLDMATQDGIRIPYPAMHRIPQGLIWGYVYNPYQQTSATHIFNSRISSYATPAMLEYGNYGLFYATAPQQISLPLPAERSTASPFILRYTGTSGALQQILQEAKSALPSGTEVRVYDWRGFVY